MDICFSSFWVKSESCSVVSNSLRPHGLYSPWNSPDQNTGVGKLSLLQGIFPTQGSNPGLPHCRWILYLLSHKGSPRILEWIDCPFSSGSSQSRNRTGVSYIAGGFFTSWDMREAPFNSRTAPNISSFLNRVESPFPWFYVSQSQSLVTENKYNHAST